MKKILFVMSMAILIALCSTPSFVNAAEVTIGKAYVNFGTPHIVDIFINVYDDFVPRGIYFSGYSFYVSDHWTNPTKSYQVYFAYNGPNGSMLVNLSESNCIYGYIPTLTYSYTWNYDNISRTVYNNQNDFENSLPSDLQPTLAEKRWNAFYEWYKHKFGFYPVDGSLIDLLRKFALGDDSEDTEITFPTLTPTPTSTPTPTPIPVQTIFVPDGNGNTTIIYQYPDPTTGIITQSPYNPNIQNNIDVNCDCDGGGNNIFGTEPTDPYTLSSSMLWADGFGVEITDNPLTAANDSQKSLAEAAAEYSDSVNVVSNSFNVLPFKWLVLVGLLGGILIISGLIRTFLGG